MPSIHPIDDLPFHQQPGPFDLPATTDAHFNDGYFFAFYAPGRYVVTGLRLHPNTNTMDGFAAVAVDGEQRSIRLSRALRPRYDDLAVGPLRLEFPEPMRRQHLVLAGDEAGFGFDVVLEAQSPPFLESRYQHEKHGTVVNDLLRYTQMGRAAGTLHLDGEAVPVSSWHAMRDHSWGIRSNMGPRTPVGGVETSPAGERRAFRLWVPFECGDHCGFFHTHEDRSGNTLDFEGRIDHRDGRSVALRSVTHRLHYEPGTRQPTEGTIELFGEDGAVRRYELRPSGSPADVQGLGYYGGWRDGGSPGVYRGPEAVEVDRYPTGTPEERSGPPHVPVAKRLGPTEFPCAMTGADGGDGMAHFEHHVFGRYEPYDLS